MPFGIQTDTDGDHIKLSVTTVIGATGATNITTANDASADKSVAGTTTSGDIIGVTTV